MFRIAENIHYYSKTDYKIAEKKFVKYALTRRITGIQKES